MERQMDKLIDQTTEGQVNQPNKTEKKHTSTNKLTNKQTTK
jgi:hypothetical protein